MGVGALHRLCFSGPSPNEMVGGAVTGGHFLPVFIFSFVNCYSNCSKIAFQLAQIYSYLVWNVTFEVTAI